MENWLVRLRISYVSGKEEIVSMGFTESEVKYLNQTIASIFLNSKCIHVTLNNEEDATINIKLVERISVVKD